MTPGDGNEGNPAKHWVPAADDAEAWWMVDTAGIYDMSEVQFTWAGEAEAHRYKVEVSYDGVTWAPVADHMTDGVSGLASTDKVGQTARYLRVSVAQGTSEGFYVRLKGRAIETSRALVQVLDVEPVVTEVGTPFSELGLPAEVMVQLEGDVATSLPVIWDEGSYDAETAGSQTVSGTLSLIPGVSADESALVASVVVTLEEPPAPVLDRIVVTAPAKTTYVQGEEFELAGMKVEAVYSDGSRVNVTDEATVSGFDPSKTSDPDDQQGDKRPSDDVKPSDEKPAGSASDDAALPSAGEAADPTASLLTLGLLATASAAAVRGARRER